jgi:uncharacterized protein
VASAEVEAIRAVYVALADGDAGPLAALMDPDIEWTEPDGAPGIAGTYRGRSAVFTEVFARIPEVWQEFRVEPELFLDAGTHVVVTGTLAVRAFGTGGRAQAPFAHVWGLRDGRVASWRCFTDTALLHSARVSR